MPDEDYPPTQAQIRSFNRQLADHGPTALERARRSLTARLEEHTEKLVLIVEAGGNPASVEREIANFKRPLNAIAAVLGETS